MKSCLIILLLVLWFFLCGCANTGYVNLSRSSFTLVVHGRLAVNQQMGGIRLEQSATTQAAQLEGVNSTPNPETARAIAAGVAEGVIRAGTRP